MSEERPPLAKSELEAAWVVWAIDEAPVRQVHEALLEQRKLDFWTVQTYLRRLKDKEYLDLMRSKAVIQTNVHESYSICC